MSYDDLVSDGAHVVLSGDQISELMTRLGKDVLSDDEVDFMSLAEEYDSDMDSEPPPAPVKAQTNTVEYFTEENVDYMPNWAKDMFLSGTHCELEQEVRTSLHDIAAKNRGDEVDEEGKGIEKCKVADVAEDYGVPEEFVVDVMMALEIPEKRFGLPIRQACSAEQIEQMLTLLTTFDSGDLRERYSDYTLLELAENHEVDMESLMDVCIEAGIVVWKGESQRLLKSRETVVSNMVQGGEKQELPGVLEGLIYDGAGPSKKSND